MAYLELFRGAPGLLRLSALALLGRIPSGILGVALVLLLERETGSYSVGGLAAALFSGGAAAGGVVYGRAIARSGYRRPLALGGLTGGAALVALALLTPSLPTAVTLVLAGAAGFAFPPLSACVRGQWNRVYLDPERRLRAATFESVVGEIAFLVGPGFVTLAVVAGSEAVAVAAAGVMVAVAAERFGRHAASTTSAIREAVPTTPLRSAGFIATLVSGALWCISFGALSVGIVAAADAAGRRELGGAFVALVSVGAIVGGLAFGAKTVRADPVNLLPVVLAIYGGTLAPLSVASGALAAFAGLLVAVGTTSAVVLACLNVRIVAGVPAEREVEAYSWLNAFTVAGLAVGPAVGGLLIEWLGTRSAFTAAALLAGLGAAVALVGRS
jgi:MFS family permease